MSNQQKLAKQQPTMFKCLEHNVGCQCILRHNWNAIEHVFKNLWHICLQRCDVLLFANSI